MTLTPTSMLLLGVIGLLGLGFYALLASKNLIKVIVGLQILVKAALLGLVTAGGVNGKMSEAQSMGVMVIVVDTVVAVLGLALAIQIRRRVGTLNIDQLSQLKG